MSRVRDPQTGEPLLCCWDECGQWGVAEIFELMGLYYIFCSERHREYWKNSVMDNGNLPAGMRNPLGLAGR